MTNEELLNKIIQDLDGEYQIGFHHSTKDAYIFKTKYNKDKYFIDPETVTENDIVSSILSNGLYVPEKCIGLDCTVRFSKNITANSFNYMYGDRGKSYVLVVIIPNYIYINNKDYFIGDLTESICIANFSFFHTLLPKEFIYGYYVRNITLKDDEKRDYYFHNDYVFEEEFEFYPNENFYGYMSKEEQEQFWLNYFKNNNINISILDAVNYPNLFNIMFQNSRNRYAIKKTREQLLKRRKVNKSN